jgi:Tfp pilus assembly protein PilF
MLLREHRAPESVRAAERALAVEPYAPNAWAALAAAHLDGGDPASARRDSGMALELLNDYPFALQIRAVAAEQLGDGQAAREDRRRLRALADGKDDDTSRTARALLHAAE